MNLRVACCVLLLTTACTATETGNPLARQVLSLSARSSSDAVSTTEESAALQVTSAWIVLDELRFVKSEECDRGAQTRVTFEGPVAVELVNARERLDLSLEEAKYCRLRLRLHAEDDLQGAPGELEDHSILLRGTRRDGVTFVVRSRRSYDLELRSKGDGFDLDRVNNRIILAFDLATWLAGVDLEGASAGEGESIAVDDDADRDRLATFEENVEAAMELFRDRNEDDQLDEDEIVDRLASGRKE